MAKFRFSPVDHQKYGDRWYEVDVFDPADIDAGILEQWEETTDYRLFGNFTDQLSSRSFKALRAMCWLAYLIGAGEIAWHDFRPQVHLIEWDPSKAGEPKGEAKGPNRATRRKAAAPSKKASRSTSTSKRTT